MQLFAEDNVNTPAWITTLIVKPCDWGTSVLPSLRVLLVRFISSCVHNVVWFNRNLGHPNTGTGVALTQKLWCSLDAAKSTHAWTQGKIKIIAGRSLFQRFCTPNFQHNVAFSDCSPTLLSSFCYRIKIYSPRCFYLLPSAVCRQNSMENDITSILTNSKISVGFRTRIY